MLIEVEGNVIDTIWILKIGQIDGASNSFFLAFAVPEKPSMQIPSERVEDAIRKRDHLIDCWLGNANDYNNQTNKFELVKIS